MSEGGTGTGSAAGGFARHIRHCNSGALPGGRVPVQVDGQPVGWMRPDLVRIVAALPGAQGGPGGLAIEASSLQTIARALADAGVTRWRGEAFDVRASPDGPALAQIDRGALPLFGIQAAGVHLNGLVRRGEDTLVWVATRAADKALDPGKLDHITAGGVPAGLTPWQTLLKEAAEEAAIPEALAAMARPVARIAYTMDRPEGLRRDILHCYDLVLPADFAPHPADGEVSGFALWPLQHALEAVRDTDQFKFNVNLVLIDLFLRTGLIDPAGAEGVALRTALDAGQ